jgi:hypothetical protein
MTIPSNITPIRSRSQQFAAPMISASLAGGEGVLGQVANDDHNVGGALLALQAARVAAENCAKVTNSIHGDQTLSAGAAHVKSDEVTQRIVMSTLPNSTVRMSSYRPKLLRLWRRPAARLSIRLAVRSAAKSALSCIRWTPRRGARRSPRLWRKTIS